MKEGSLAARSIGESQSDEKINWGPVKGKTLLLTVSKYVLESTVETLRLKREDYLKMIRDIKRIQSEGTERMENFLKLKQ